MSSVLSSQTGPQERSLGGLGITSQGNVRPGNCRLQLERSLHEGVGVTGTWEGEAAILRGPARQLRAKLLHSTHAQAILSLDALEVGEVLRVGAILGAAQEGLVDRNRRIEAVEEERERLAVVNGLGFV